MEAKDSTIIGLTVALETAIRTISPKLLKDRNFADAYALLVQFYDYLGSELRGG